MTSPQRPSTRWKYHDRALLWLFPCSYLLHLVEEYATRAPVLLWHARLDRAAESGVFLSANSIGLILMSLGVALTTRSARFHWIAPALAVATLLNTAGHLVGSAAAGTYSAGLMTAVVFWIPLALLTLLRVWDQASTRTLVGGAVVGLLIEATVLWVMRIA